jgi:hypothetical protein
LGCGKPPDFRFVVARAREAAKPRLATSANAFDLSIDDRLLEIDQLLRRGYPCGNIDCAGLSVADRCQPGLLAVSFEAHASGTSIKVTVAASRTAAKRPGLYLIIEASVCCPARLNARF